MTTSSIFEQAVDAIIHGDETALDALLANNPNLAQAHSTKKHQATLLHYVSANGIEANKQKTPDNIVTIAKMLLKAGANPNQVSNIYGGGRGSTPLVGLVSSSHPADAGKMYDLVCLFCEYGNPDGVENDSLPLVTAISFRQRDAIRALADSGATINHLVTASATGKLEIVKQLFERASEPYNDSFEQTFAEQEKIREHALTVAAMAGHLEVMQYLIGQGVDINANASSSGDSALAEAITGQHIDVTRYLLEQGADSSSIPETENPEINSLLGR